MEVRTVLVDDEPKSLVILEEKLNRYFPQMRLIGKFTDPAEALETIENEDPDLVFLDIAMPGMSGFDLLKRVSEPRFEIIFVTAFGDYALEAIKHAAIGYLMKPVVNDDLMVAVTHALRNIRLKNSLEHNRFLKESLVDTDETRKKLVIPYDDGLIFSEYGKVLRLEGESGYTRIFFTDGSNILSAYNIGYYYNMLSKKVFFQTHKSHIVNTHYINRYLNEGLVELDGKHMVPLARNKKRDFMDFLKQ